MGIIRKEILVSSLEQNQHKVRSCREELPVRALYYHRGPESVTEDGGGEASDPPNEAHWKDFPEAMLDVFTTAVATNIPRWRLVVDEKVCALDLERMLLVFSPFAPVSICSVAWIDNAGGRFFPATNSVHGYRRGPLRVTKVSLHDSQADAKVSTTDPFSELLL